MNRAWPFILPVLIVLDLLWPRIFARASSEHDAQSLLCRGMELEVVLASGARADCISDTHAIEVEFSDKWAEALGQSLHYAAQTGKKPGIFLICRDQGNCLSHKLRLEETIAYWGLDVDVWPVTEEDLSPANH